MQISSHQQQTATWMEVLILLLDPFQRAIDRPESFDNGEPHPHELERMTDEGGPEPDEDDYRYADPVNDRYKGFRQ